MPENKERRRLLKLLGLGAAFMPFVSCFEQEAGQQSTAVAPGLKKMSDSADNDIRVTDEDIVLLTREDQAYARFNLAYNKRVQHLPRYIAVCQTAKGIQYAVAKARAEGLKVAVKSGGHSFEGFSANDDGMVINVSKMKKITWLSENEVAMEPGCLLQEIQAALFPKGKLLPSGSCGTVGIAGLTLGGGYGFFSRKFGLTCDSLQGFSLIAADGALYDSKDHEELLWACRGAGNGNFGVVTSFRFRVYDMPQTFDSYVLKFRNMTLERFTATLDAWFTVSAQLPQEAFSAYVLNGKTLTILITTYRKYPDFNARISSLLGLADNKGITLDAPLPQAMKRYYGRKNPLLFKNASAGLYRGKEDVLQVKEELFQQVVGNPGIIFQVNTLGGAVADKQFEEGSCYPHRQLPYLGELQAYWEQPSQEARLLSAFEAIQSLFRKSGIQAHYSNYPDVNFQDWETAYYGRHYPRLQELKRKYDPDALFDYPQAIRIKA